MVELVMTALLCTIVFGPLIGAMIAGLFGRRIGDKPSMAITTGLLFLSCALSWAFVVRLFGRSVEPQTIALMPFIEVGDFKSAWSIRLDTLSAVMLVVVTTV